MKGNNLNKYIGAIIKAKREEAGLRQEDISKVLRLSRVSVLNMEAGRHKPSLETIMTLCAIFNCTPNDIFPPVTAVKFVIEEKFVMVKKKIKNLKVLK